MQEVHEGVSVVIGHETFHALARHHARRGLMRALPRTYNGVFDQTLTDGEVSALRSALHRDETNTISDGTNIVKNGGDRLH